MLASITNWGKGKWRILTRANGSRRLSWFTLLLAFALDIYVLNLLVDGMKNAQDTVNQPFSGVSRECASASMELLAANTTERASKITRPGSTPENIESNSATTAVVWCLYASRSAKDG